MPEGQKEEIRMANGEVVTFKYPGVVADHYKYRGEVDNQNAMGHDDRTKYQIGLGGSLGTTWWLIQFFSFFIVCTEVNTYLAMKYFLKTDDSFMNY